MLLVVHLLNVFKLLSISHYNFIIQHTKIKCPVVCLLLLEQCYVKIVYISVVQSVLLLTLPHWGVLEQCRLLELNCYTGLNHTFLKHIPSLSSEK